MAGQETDLTDTAKSQIMTDNDSKAIQLFWGWNHPQFFIGIAWVLFLPGPLFGWIWWIQHGHHKGWTIFWIVYVGCCLGYLLICALLPLAVFIASVLTAPFVIIHSFYAFCIAPFYVVTTNFFERIVSGPPNCRLCPKCESCIARSPLLIGSRWILARSNKTHPFHTIDQLEASAETCHLCSLLWNSIIRKEQKVPLPAIDSLEVAVVLTKSEAVNVASCQEAIPMGGIEKAVPTSINCDSSDLKLSQSLEVQNCESLKVKVWMESFCLRKPVIRMQICGGPILTSATLKLEKSTASVDPASHNCFHSQRTDSQNIIDWAKCLIDQCSKEHELCKGHFVADELRNYRPKRLLDLQSPQDESISLVTTAGLSAQSVQYFALSHCWGGKIDTTLRKDNIRDMTGIDLNALPINFQDAISITRRLGVRYLWIDSLCIVQDDDQEWGMESTNMGLVYANAQCAISATASKDSTGGCFKTRDLFRSDCILRRKGTRQLVVRPLQQSDLLNLFKEKIDRAPLTRRGWTFQERYLASRTLHFASGVVLFECNKLIASDHDHGQIGQEYSLRQVIRSDGKLHPTADCEYAQKAISKILVTTEMAYISGGRDGSGHYYQREIKSPNPLFAKQQDIIKVLTSNSARLGMRSAFDFLWRYSGKDFREAVEFHQSWFEMIEHYSTRDLTHHEDKLMAISGVAYFIQRNTKLTYNSGIWEEIMSFNLLWEVLSEPKKRPDRSIPTWSWASIDGRISHRLKEVSLPKKNQFRSAWREISCHIPEKAKVTVKDKANGLIFNSKLEISSLIGDFHPRTVNVSWDVLDEHTGRFPGASTDGIFVLPILSFQNSNVHPMGSEMQLHGILLREKFENTYERVGYFWTTDKKTADKILSDSVIKSITLI